MNAEKHNAGVCAQILRLFKISCFCGGGGYRTRVGNFMVLTSLRAAGLRCCFLTCARSSTAHVTHRRSAHPRFTSSSPSSPASIVRSPPPHLCSPVLPGMCSSPVTRLSRKSTSGEKDLGEPEWAPGAVMGLWYQDVTTRRDVVTVRSSEGGIPGLYKCS